MLTSVVGGLVYDPVPDFHRMSDVETKKTVFLAFLAPKFRTTNAMVRSERQRLQNVLTRLAAGNDSWRDRIVLGSLADKYEVTLSEPPTNAEFERLLRRVDTIPLSLALAQAAKESGWGTSRFAQQHNNFYGMWCFEAGCGVVPNQRVSGLSHEVAEFSSVLAGTEYYLMNLNTHPAYQQLRRTRADLRAAGETVTGLKLASGLSAYSERGQAYVDEIVKMIRFNQLQTY